MNDLLDAKFDLPRDTAEDVANELHALLFPGDAWNVPRGWTFNAK